MFAHGNAFLQLFPVVWIFMRSLGVICYDIWVLREGRKNYFKDWCLMNSQLTFLFLTNLNLMNLWQFKLLSKASKPDNFESHNFLKLRSANIPGLHSNFVDCESFLESNCPDILALCETNLDDSIDSCNFSVRGYLSLIRIDSGTHVHGLAVYVREGLPFAREFISRKLCKFLLMFLTDFTTLLFFLSITFFVFVHSFLFHFI